MLTLEARILQHARKYYDQEKLKLASALLLVYSENKRDRLLEESDEEDLDEEGKEGKMNLTEDDKELAEMEATLAKELFAEDDIEFSEEGEDFSFDMNEEAPESDETDEEPEVVETITIEEGDDPVVLVPEGSDAEIPEDLEKVELPEGSEVKVEVTVEEESSEEAPESEEDEVENDEEIMDDDFDIFEGYID